MDFGEISIKWLGHDAFEVKWRDKTIYIDPFQISGREKADLVLVTHEHYDHCSPQDIDRIYGDKTKIVCNSATAKKLGGKSKIVVEAGESVEVDGIKIRAVPAYNTNKPFHPRGAGIGFLVELGEKTLYHAGDTDFIPEMKSLSGKVDIAMLPVSGTYVMNAREAAKAAETIKPGIAIPMHYGSIIGSREDAEHFRELYTGKTAILEKEK